VAVDEGFVRSGEPGTTGGEPVVESAPLVQPDGYDTGLMPRFRDLLGDSEALAGLRRELEQLVRRYGSARRLPPVLLLGETGTGKSMIARALHAEGPRAGRPFVDVACPEIPETLMESEMFGVERGAYTDARQSRPGRFAEADRGTIFLDEIGLLPDNLQAKLLKIVEEQQLRPLGATGSKPIDVWIIAATSEDLEAAVRKRRFREDLYFRLAVVTLKVPPLRERADDVVLLARHLLARACADYGLTPKTFAPSALATLQAHAWKGNVRELSNVIERVALRSEGALVTDDVLDLPVAEPKATPDDRRPGPRRAALDDTVAAVERKHLSDAIAAAEGNVSKAAQRLGLTRNTLRYRMRKHRLLRAVDATPPSPSASPTVSAAPAAAPGWERRRVAFLRVMLDAAGEDDAYKARAVLEEARQKALVFGGVVDGVSPGSITAVFGLDLAEDAPRRAAHAAMAIRKLGARARAGDATRLTMKLAVHAVQTLLWKAADGVQVDGDARPGVWQALDGLVTRADDGIVVSEAAAGLLRSAFHLRDAGDRDGAYSVLVDGEPPAPPATTGSGFVGRGDEMAMLQGRLELALSGRGQVVGIDGEPGIGKSRLLFEFRRVLDVTRIDYLTARSVSHGRDLPLLPIIELVRGALGVTEGDNPTTTVGKIRSHLNALAMPSDETMPYLMRLLGLEDRGDRLAQLEPGELHQRTLATVRSLVLVSARVRPLVLAVEDLHWMDRTSESYLAALVDALVETRVLLLTTHRTGHQLGWNDRSYFTGLRLQPLSRADARRVLLSTLARDSRPSTLPVATVDAILDRADGNPFFVEELAKAIEPDVEETATVPDSVEAVLLARIDRLSDAPKSVLQAASVLGREVPVRLLEAVASDLAPREHLRELQRLEYLYERSAGAQELYRFKHALTQEVAYSSLLPERRRALHARIVGAVEALYADRLDEQTERLAQHAMRGELWERALRYQKQAGLNAMARAANHEAVACLEQALQAQQRLPPGGATVEGIDIRYHLIRALVATGQYRRCHPHLAEAAATASALGQRGRLGWVLSDQCLIFRITGATSESIEAGRQALAIATEMADAALATTASFFLATAYQMRGDLQEAAVHYRLSITPLEGELTPENAQSLHRHAASARSFLAWTLELLGEFTEGLSVAREGLAIAQARGDRLHEAVAACFLGGVHLGRGDAGEAIPFLEHALALCRTYNVSDWVSPITARLGFAYTQAGRVAEAIPLLREAVGTAGASGQLTGYPTRVARLAYAHLLAGQRGEAEETIGRGLSLARERHLRADEAECLRVLGLIAATSPADLDLAEAYLAQARDLAVSLGMRPLIAHCHFDLGTLFRRAVKLDRAREHFAIAASMYGEMDATSWRERAKAEAAQMA
jgi:DNA-binding NtrC family response regulator/tetratricopeptide (TPR) repeat protein